MTQGCAGGTNCADCGEKWPPFLLEGIQLPGCPACEAEEWRNWPDDLYASERTLTLEPGRP